MIWFHDISFEDVNIGCFLVSFADVSPTGQELVFRHLSIFKFISKSHLVSGLVFG